MSCMELDDDACRKVAEPMMDDTINGVLRRNFNEHTRHFSVALKSSLDADAFSDACESRQAAWGNPIGRELVSIFRKPKSFTLVWNQGFDRADGQVMAVMTIALKGGRYFVDFFMLH